MVKWRSHHPRNDLAGKECVASVQRFVIQIAHSLRSHILASRPIEVEHVASMASAWGGLSIIRVVFQLSCVVV